MSQVIGLFPTPFMRVEALLGSGLVSALVDHFGAAATLANARSGLLAHTEILSPADSPHFIEAGRLIVPKLAEFGLLMFGERLNWSIKEMWVNVLQAGGQQAMHNHANSFVSGVIYLTRSHPSANTVFMKGPGGSAFAFGNVNANTHMGPFNADKWIMPEAAPGDMVLFPSYLLHEVPVNQGGERISLAFNAIPDRLDSWGYGIRFSP
jgi:uncharacterized protein (TIGR02466 family)